MFCSLDDSKNKRKIQRKKRMERENHMKKLANMKKIAKLWVKRSKILEKTLNLIILKE
jgi:hypothetical protein